MMTYDADDTLPQDYKRCLVHLMTFQADSEYAGAQRVAENMKYAPRPEEAYRLSKKVMEEMGHAYYIWTLLRDFDVDVDARLCELVEHPDNPDPSKVNIINGFRKENWTPLFECWEDVTLFSTVVTPAAVAFLGQYRECSYLPFARVNQRIHREEFGHLAFGVWASKRCIEFGGEKTRAFMQERIPKFMRVGLGFYGRPSEGERISENFRKYYTYGLKVKKPEELQAEYLGLLESRLEEVGLKMPQGVEPDYEMRVGYAVGEAA